MNKLQAIRKEKRKKLRDWAKLTKELAGKKCQWCGATKYLNSHHIIGKRAEGLRYNQHNCLVLCARCHKFLVGMAAHENPIRVFLWLQEHRPESLQILIDWTLNELKRNNK